MSIINLLNKQTGRVTLVAACMVCVFSLAINTASAGDREKAKFIHDRIAGVPPTNAVLTTMAANIAAGNTTAAVTTAMNNINFLNVTAKNMVMPWTNKDSTVFADFNDSAATILGYIKDGKDFRGILFDDVIYVGVDPSLSAFPYSNSNNNHYIQMENRNLNLRNVLQQQVQSATTGRPAGASAGVFTTRQTARAFMYAGTNRAVLRFEMLNYMCTDMNEIKDVTRVNNYVRRDASRSPGGDSDIFMNNCVGCHAGMDGMDRAYAYYTWGPNVFDNNLDPETQSMLYQTTAVTYNVDGAPVATPTRVTRKHRINASNFEYGWEVVDDSWVNYWRTGQNANLGWGLDPALTPSNTPQAPFSGSGAAALGRELANTTAFTRCQAIKVYRQVCLNDPTETTLNTLTTNFANSNYDLRTVFTDSVIDCMNSNPNL